MATNIATVVLMVANAFIWLHNLKIILAFG